MHSAPPKNETPSAGASRSGWFSPLDRTLDRIIMALSYAAAAILLFMAISVGYEVVMRYFLNSPTRWVVEFSEYMLLYMAFLPGAWVLQRDRHVKIDLILQTLSPRVQSLINTMTSGIGTILCGLFFWFSASLVWETFQSKEILFRAVHVPKWAVLAVIPVGLLLLTLQFARRTVLYGKELSRGRAKEKTASGKTQRPEVR